MDLVTCLTRPLIGGVYTTCVHTVVVTVMASAQLCNNKHYIANCIIIAMYVYIAMYKQVHYNMPGHNYNH